jgi:hypothetical protein
VKERLRYVQELITDAEAELEQLRSTCFYRPYVYRLWRGAIFQGRKRAAAHVRAVLPKVVGVTDEHQVRDILLRRARRWLYETSGTPRDEWEDV